MRFFTAHPTAANLLMVIFFALGLVALPGLQRASFPDLPVVLVEVTVPYPGASPTEVEEAICARLEEAVEGVNDLVETVCEALENRARAVFEMNERANLDRFFNDIKTEIEAIDTFPTQAETPVVRRLGLTFPVTSIAIYGPLSRPHLKVYAEQVRDRLQTLPEVSQVDISGFSDRQIRIQIDAQTLRQFGLSTADIANRIAKQSVELPSGTIETGQRDILIRFNDERRNPREFEDLIVVSSATGAEIRLGDIAVIEDLFELAEDKATFDGQPAALLTVIRSRSDDTLNVIDAVHRFVDKENARAPENVRMTLTQDSSSLVRDRLNLLVKNGSLGLVLVMLVLLLFFGTRYSFWVALGLPVSFGGTLFIMSVFGITLDLISMVGLLIAVGVLMDDAIVIAENIAAHHARGESAIDAAINGTKEVMPSVTSSFLTTAFVFGPLMFLTGNLGAVLKAMPTVLLITISISLIEAFLILPNHLHHSLAHEGRSNAFVRFGTAVMTWIATYILVPLTFLLPRAAQEKLVQWAQKALHIRDNFATQFDAFRDHRVIPFVETALTWRYLSVGVIIAVLILSVGMLAGGVLKFQAFPTLDSDSSAARVLLPPGTPLEQTEAIVDKVVAAAQRVNADKTPEQPGGQALIRHILVQHNVNTIAGEKGPHVVTVSLELLGTEIRTTTIDEFNRAWRSEIGRLPDVLNIYFAGFELGPAGLPIHLQMSGPNLDELSVASQELTAWLTSYDSTQDISNDLRPGKPEMELRLREGALALGLDAQMIAGQLRAAFHGTTAAEIQVGSESFEIDVRLDAQDRNSFSDLEYFTITAPDGRLIPLGSVVDVTETRGFSRIRRINGLRTVTIKGGIDGERGNASEVISDTTTRFLPQLLERYPDLNFNFEGETAEAAETSASIQQGFILGLMGIFTLLSMQFRSYTEPMIVMLIIPLALIGVVWGHLLMGTQFVHAVHHRLCQPGRNRCQQLDSDGYVYQDQRAAGP